MIACDVIARPTTAGGPIHYVFSGTVVVVGVFIVDRRSEVAQVQNVEVGCSYPVCAVPQVSGD